MSGPRAIDLGLGVLDHQLVDSEERRCGKVDDLELEDLGEERPCVAAIVSGSSAWAGPGHPRAPGRASPPGAGRPRAVERGARDRLRGAPAATGARPATRTRRRPGATARRADPVFVRLSALLGLRVTTESGGRLGRVHDVRGELTDRNLWITGLVVGRAGVLERLGIGAPRSAARIRAPDVVPCSAVVRADRRGVVVRDGTRPE